MVETRAVRRARALLETEERSLSEERSLPNASDPESEYYPKTYSRRRLVTLEPLHHQVTYFQRQPLYLLYHAYIDLFVSV